MLLEEDELAVIHGAAEDVSRVFAHPFARERGTPSVVWRRLRQVRGPDLRERCRSSRSSLPGPGAAPPHEAARAGRRHAHLDWSEAARSTITLPACRGASDAAGRLRELPDADPFL